MRAAMRSERVGMSTTTTTTAVPGAAAVRRASEAAERGAAERLRRLAAMRVSMNAPPAIEFVERAPGPPRRPPTPPRIDDADNDVVRRNRVSSQTARTRARSSSPRRRRARAPPRSRDRAAASTTVDAASTTLDDSSSSSTMAAPHTGVAASIAADLQRALAMREDIRSRGLSSSSSSSLDASRAHSARNDADVSSEWSIRGGAVPPPSVPRTPLDRSEASGGFADDRSGEQSHVRIDARVRDKCPLCTEQAYYLVQSHRARAASTDPGVRGRNDALQKIDDKRMLIFQLEQILSIEEPDAIVFQTLLDVRRTLIERPLSLYNITYVPWTLVEIERHFVECRIDALRRARRTAAMYEQLERDAHDAAYIVDPATGAKVLDQQRAIAATRIGDQRLKLEREVDRLKREREKEYGSPAVRVPAILAQLRGLEQAALRIEADPLGGGASLSLGGF